MPAHVVECPNFEVVIANQQDALACNIDESIVALFLEPLYTSGTKPFRVKDTVALSMEVTIVEISIARQCLFEPSFHRCDTESAQKNCKLAARALRCNTLATPCFDHYVDTVKHPRQLRSCNDGQVGLV